VQSVFHALLAIDLSSLYVFVLEYLS